MQASSTTNHAQLKTYTNTRHYYYLYLLHCTPNTLYDQRV
jgi:hypothetical protein